ncbi:MAG: elongation factor G [Spirochaetes bacterium]|nr:elongation factor G [Spirochaetota bacterium]MBN2770484.1 elongation factor G [Spirochaetota bacterium]
MVKKYAKENIRNVVIVGHAGTGKSTLMDSILFTGNKIKKIGSHNDGSLISDFDIEEKKKKMSVHTAMGFVETEDIKINIIDCPGHADLIGERRAAIQAADAAILVLDSVDGVQVGTEKVWRYLAENNIPRIIFVNKMDQERASYENVITSMEATLHANLVVAAIPISEGDSFDGVVDIIEMKSMKQKAPGSNEIIRGEIPADLVDKVQEQRSRTVELAAEGDDELIEMFLEGKDFDADKIYRGINEQIRQNKLHPVICGAALKGVGVQTLLHFIKEFMPSPAEKAEMEALDLDKNASPVTIKCNEKEPLTAVVWKTYIDQFAGKFSYFRVISGEVTSEIELMNTDCKEKEKIGKIYTMIGKELVEVEGLSTGDIGVFVKLDKTITTDTLCDLSRNIKVPIINLPGPVFGYSIKAKDKKDEEKLGQILNRYDEQYPTLHYSYNSETRQATIYGMGQLHLDITLDEIHEKYKIEFETDVPRISYCETITKKAEAQYKHKKQSGGHGQYGEVYLRLHPKPRGEGYSFKESIVGGVVPKNYIPGVEKGVLEALKEGVVARYPVVDVEVELFDGSFHPVDSSEMSFKIASQHAFRKAMSDAAPVILEPIMHVSVYVDNQFVGDVMGDITSRRGRVLGMDSKDEENKESITRIRALIPHAELLRYSIDLTALTQNKAVFEMEFHGYEPISGRVADKVIADRESMLAEES